MGLSYQKYVAEYARLLNEGVTTRLVRPAAARRAAPSKTAACGLVFAPHPDDECIIGALPLRLLRELKMRIIDVAVTLGSRKDRQRERQQELQNACELLGFKPLVPADGGLGKINPTARLQTPDRWRNAVQLITDILCQHKPRVIFYPHDADANSTHVGVNLLLADALADVDHDFCCWVCETEYWSPIKAPNLMIESSVADVADLVAALALHTGEVKRNPYHLRLPAWMIDNVRRGGELVGGQGGEPPPFTFATLYRLRKWVHGHLEEYPSGKMISVNDSLEDLFG